MIRLVVVDDHPAIGAAISAAAADRDDMERDAEVFRESARVVEGSTSGRARSRGR